MKCNKVYNYVTISSFSTLGASAPKGRNPKGRPRDVNQPRTYKLSGPGF